MSDDDLDRDVALAWAAAVLGLAWAAVVAFFAALLGLAWVLAGWLI